MADDSALVVVAPNDSVDAIVQKIRGAGADRIELLVPDGTPALQALGGFARLRQSLGTDQVGLLVISSDEKTLNAARLNQLDTMGVEGTRVAFPEAAGNGGQADRYATQVLPREAGATRPISDHDAEFLQALDQMPRGDRYAAEEDADLYAAIDDPSTVIDYQAAVDRVERSADEDFAAALDEWSSGDGDQPSASEEWGSAFVETSGAPRRRVRAEELEVSADELERQRGSRRATAQRAATETPGRGTARARRGRATARLLDLEEAEEVAPRRSFAAAIPLLILLLVVAFAAVWYFRNRATIAVALPVARTSQHPFQNEVIPIAASGAAKSPDAVQATAISADAQFSVQGQVISETLAPAATAKGVVTLINRTGQAIPLPEGTQFIAVKEQGQEVRFKLDQSVTAPAATTSSSLTGSSTTFGTVDIAVTALSPGSASNVGENAIKQILIPGQQPITTDSSNFVMRNAPITGGEDRPVRIVTDDDVQGKLKEALTGLYNAGIRALQGQIDARTQAIDTVSIYPRPDPDSLGNPQNYDISVEPPVGQPVDENNPAFTVTVKRRFSALATPRDAPLLGQLQIALQQHLNPRSPCKAGETPALDLSDYRWDRTKLTADALITCTPSSGLTAETIAAVKSAVRGKSRAEAESGLRALQKQGLIGDYFLPPDKDQFPNLDFLLAVEQGPGPRPEPTPAAQ